MPSDGGPAGPADAEESLDRLLARLEAAIGRLTEQNAPLDRLVADYELAGELLVRARRRWEEAELRVQRLRPLLQSARRAP